MPFNINSSFVKFALTLIQKYNHNKYWSRREKVTNPNYSNKLLKLYYLYYIKKVDDYYNCSFGTNLNSGTVFNSPPNLPHGPKNIIVGHNLIIGKNVTIYQGVTLAHGGSTIGDNVLIGANAVVLPGLNVGNNAKIGANTVVTDDVPDNATLVNQKSRLIYN